jgi:hypothetical protein
MSGRSSRKKGKSSPKAEGFTFTEALKSTKDAGGEGFAVEPVSTSADKDSGEESEKSASYYTDDPSAGMAAQAYKVIQHRVLSKNRSPERRSLENSDKVVTTPDSGAKVPTQMKALLLLMDDESRAQYLGWLAMYEGAMREGNVSRASRAEGRMADIENKVFGVISGPTEVGSSSGSSESSGDSAAVAASVDAVLSARAGDAAAKKTLTNLESALDKQISASAPIKKYKGSIALDTIEPAIVPENIEPAIVPESRGGQLKSSGRRTSRGVQLKSSVRRTSRGIQLKSSVRRTSRGIQLKSSVRRTSRGGQLKSSVRRTSRDGSPGSLYKSR